MVLGLPCQFDYRNITYAFQRTFGHLLPPCLRNRDYIDGPHDRHDYPPASPGGYSTSTKTDDHNQTQEQEEATVGKGRDAAIYQNELSSPTASSMRKGSSSQRSSINGGKKEVRWDGGVVGGEDDDGVSKKTDKGSSIGQAL
ncbi:hypothetical protein TWF696_001603 [Orbilia brochopaga]|uniref:Uncharacterized protein n=1 Tax=Orbilia brochopaga TaxID=3140254 RepID=A0AAV9UAU7_9PEZI